MPTDRRLQRAESDTAVGGGAVQFTAGSRLSNAGLETLFGNGNVVSWREMNLRRCLQAYRGKTGPTRVQAGNKTGATLKMKASHDIKFELLRKLHEKSNAGSVSLREVKVAFDECLQGDGSRPAK